MAMNTNPAVAAAGAPGSFNADLLDSRMDQFFTGMLSGWTGCAKVAGTKAAAATNAARSDITEPRLEDMERGHAEFITAVSFSLRI
jgi:hypothetical protein